MEYKIIASIKKTPQGKQAEEILSKCVHCGMCNATCPTYQLLGDELDGPRGRIYQIKQVLEGATPTRTMQLHLDRCLTCLSCETTCPSGVKYGKLAEIGKQLIDDSLQRPLHEKLFRKILRIILPYPNRLGPLVRMGQICRPVLPAFLKNKIPEFQNKLRWPETKHTRTMLVLNGCAQPVMSPNINMATANVLDKLGISLLSISNSGCCGAVSQHLGAEHEAKKFMRANIDAWWPYIENGAEAIVITASGCGTVLKDYGQLLADDPDYSQKASIIATLSQDISEILSTEDMSRLHTPNEKPTLAFQSPCSLQHSQQLSGVVEKILTDFGYRLTTVKDAHLCCGSAGTYSLLQSNISNQLKVNKLKTLEEEQPELIATANIGCLHHLQSGTDIPVQHWIEIIDRM
ncbi:MAG: glycolate oxidase iron-sulfur subunit [Methylophaga sp.]|nr:MAG: glycolate oxidase iron-sulfur subunit [Methylophaga sp.]